MLKQRKVSAAIAVKDIERAKKFYSEKLGLTPEKESPAGVSYVCGNGTEFFLFPTEFAGTAKNTVMGWETDDVEAEVAELKAKGVVFEEYDMPELKTVNNIATMGPEKAAWFKDSEGNILAISQS